MRAAIQVSISPEVAAACERAAESLGLVHSLHDMALFRMERPELLSPVRLGRPPSPARRFAGTEDTIFFYVGPTAVGGLERAGALVFRADVEVEGVVVTPWDSGGLYRHRAQHLKDAERKALLQRRTMPAPGYRRALAATLLLRFGGSAERYVRSELVEATDPDEVCDGTPPSFTYEARFPGRLAVQRAELALVVVHREYLSEGLHRMRAWCGEHQIPFEVIDEQSRSRTVRDTVLEYALRQLP